MKVEAASCRFAKRRDISSTFVKYTVCLPMVPQAVVALDEGRRNGFGEWERSIAAMRKTLFVVAAIGVVILLARWDALGQEQKKPIFKKMDTSGDGKVSADEYAAGRKAWFKEMDADADGKVSAAEFVAGHFEKMNLDDDDDVELDEFMIFFVGAENKDKKAAEASAKEGKKTEWEKRDANGDGEMTVEEYILHFQMEFKQTDANGDGRILATELSANHEKIFRDLDANGDGFLTVEEFVVMPAKE
ncbi:MAG: hypothetical protein AB1696_27625 [Planctomycetota bacterium]